MYYNKKWYDTLLLVLALKCLQHFKASKSININTKDYPNVAPSLPPSPTQNGLKLNGLTFRTTNQRTTLLKEKRE
jgi:hypothetical protein